MLCYRCHFEWCHRAELAAMNYCRAFDAVFIPAVLSTHIIVVQIPDPRTDVVNKAARKMQTATSCHDDSVYRNVLQQLPKWGRVSKGVPR